MNREILKGENTTLLDLSPLRVLLCLASWILVYKECENSLRRMFPIDNPYPIFTYVFIASVFIAVLFSVNLPATSINEQLMVYSVRCFNSCNYNKVSFQHNKSFTAVLHHRLLKK